ncbi:MAG: hypothetical protein GY915_01880, partial [bacterium]|nr:hypothetical protein [bacterium]
MNRRVAIAFNFFVFSFLVALSFFSLSSVEASQASLEEWEFDSSGNFVSPQGEIIISPWNQPKELRQARNCGEETVQSLLKNSATRINKLSNGDLILHLWGRGLGGMMRKKTGKKKVVPLVTIYPLPRNPPQRSLPIYGGSNNHGGNDDLYNAFVESAQYE